jgi:hypothetical protein
VIGWLLTGPLTRLSVGSAVIVGVAAVLTSAQSMAMIAAGCVPLALRAARESSARAALVAWIITSLMLYALFQSLRQSFGSAASLLGVQVAPILRIIAESVVANPGRSASLALGSILGVLGLAAGSLAALAVRDRITLFWLYLLTFAAVFILLIGVGRGEFHARYHLITWLMPASTVVLAWQIAKHCDAGRARWVHIVGALAVLWCAATLYQSIAFGRILAGWELLSAATVEKARTNPDALVAADFNGIGGREEAVVTRGLAIMKDLKVNIFHR